LGINTMPSGYPVFDRTGEVLVWGNQDGTVSVCRLPRVREQLRALGLDWPE
jgi:hypothetical protein